MRVYLVKASKEYGSLVRYNPNSDSYVMTESETREPPHEY
jgi:hypothetical protein